MWVCFFPHILAIRMGCVIIFLNIASWYIKNGTRVLISTSLSTDEFEQHYVCSRVIFFFFLLFWRIAYLYLSDSIRFWSFVPQFLRALFVLGMLTLCGIYKYSLPVCRAVFVCVYGDFFFAMQICKKILCNHIFQSFIGSGFWVIISKPFSTSGLSWRSRRAFHISIYRYCILFNDCIEFHFMDLP